MISRGALDPMRGGWDSPHRRKLTPQQRWDVTQRRNEGEDPKDLALEFGITASYVRQL
ncbi:MAG TPA: hypothetical protein VIY48_07305 [Candidatus Paceibacterota bacterium]